MNTIEHVISLLCAARGELVEGKDACEIAEAMPYPYTNTLMFIETSLMWSKELKTRLDLAKPPASS